MISRGQVLRAEKARQNHVQVLSILTLRDKCRFIFITQNKLIQANKYCLSPFKCKTLCWALEGMDTGVSQTVSVLSEFPDDGMQGIKKAQLLLLQSMGLQLNEISKYGNSVSLTQKAYWFICNFSSMLIFQRNQGQASSLKMRLYQYVKEKNSLYEKSKFLRPYILKNKT